jgi:hypothetical protein
MSFRLFDYTATLITAGYIPAFVALTTAIEKNVDYALPTPAPSYVYMNGQNATFYLQDVQLIQVQYAWLIFVLLFMFGTLWATIVLAAHASYFEWPSRAHHHEAALTHHQRMHLKVQQAQQRAQDEQNKKYDNDIEDDFSSGA